MPLRRTGQPSILSAQTIYRILCAQILDNRVSSHDSYSAHGHPRTHPDKTTVRKKQTKPLSYRLFTK